MTLIAGIDGCGPNWLCITLNTQDRSLSARVVSTPEFLPLTWAFAAIDIPIGVPDAGPREADRQARAFLRAPRASSVFPCPLRATLQCESWEDMGAITRRLTGRGVAKQTFAILRKVREVNELVRADPLAARCFIEVHPEVSFAAWRGAAMKFNKKRPEGRAERLELIDAHFGKDATTVVRESLKGTKVPSDDIADAFAALWSAERYLLGRALSLPSEPVYDSESIPMVIWY